MTAAAVRGRRRTAGWRFAVARTLVLPRCGVTVLLLLFLLAPSPLPGQDCNDPISGCSPSEMPSDEDEDNDGGHDDSDSCPSCPELLEAYAEVVALYYGGQTPGPALTQSSDGALVDSDQRVLQRILVSLGSGEYLAKAQGLTGGAVDGYAAASSASVELAGLVERKGLTTNSSVAGDPNILASGTLTHTETDIHMPVGEVACAVERTYRSDRAQWSSFGPGWSGTGDARIILGTIPNLAPIFAALHAARGRLESLIESSDADVAAAIARLRDHRDRVVAPNGSLAEQAERRAREVYNQAVSSATGSSGEDLIADCETLCSLTRSTAEGYRALVAALSRGLALLADLAPGGDTREAVAELAASVSLLERRAEWEYRQGLANTEKNRMALHSEDPREYSQCGVDSVTLVDGQGVPHLYHFDALPGLDEEVGSYADGYACYFPHGARLTPVNPLEPPLSLGADGSWVVARGDGSSDRYSFFGLIEAAVDRNGNTVRFERADHGALTAVADACGRRILVDIRDGKIVSAVDPLGRTIRYDYGPTGMLTSVTDATGCAVRYHYAEALLTAIEKPDGTRITYEYGEYDGRTVLFATVDEEGFGEQFAYGDGWTLHTDRSGVSTTYRFNEEMRELAVEHADGSRRTKEYDGQGRVVRTTDELGSAVSYSRDAHGNVVRTTLADGTTRLARFDASDRAIEEVDGRGGRTVYRYDERGNLLSIIHPDSTRRSFAYDSSGNRLSVTDERGAVTRFSYDRFGMVESRRAPDGGVVRYEHDAVGNLVSVVDELGNRTQFRYADDNRPTAVIDPLGREERFRYDCRKDLVERIDRVGGSTHFEYDRRHLCTRIVDPAGIARVFRYRADGRIILLAVDDRDPVAYEYDTRGRLAALEQSGRRRLIRHDAAGRIVAVTDANGNTMRLIRDALGRPVSIVDALGNAKHLRYDAAGNLVSVRDALGAETRFEFDVCDRLVARRDALGGRRRYAYDANGNLTSRTDERDATVSYAYDSCNRVTDVTDPRGAARHYTYTPRGRVATSTDRNGNTWCRAYDPVGLLVTLTDPLGGRLVIAYDAEGRPVSSIDPNGNSTRFEYDGAGRLTSRIDPYGAAVRYSYEALDAIEAVTGPRGETWRYGYDGQGRLESVRDPLGDTTAYRYDGNGNLLAAIGPTGATVRFEYDALNRLCRRIDPTGAAVTWSHDPEGRVLSETDPLGRAYRFSYDSLGRLSGEVGRSGQRRRYSYDPAGNPVAERDFEGNEIRYTYDLSGRIATIDAPDGASSFSYDPEGNLVSARNSVRSYRFSYDALARVTAVRDDLYQWRREYRYDANGNCTELRDQVSGAVDRLRYGKNNELLAVTSARREETDFEYDRGGNLVRARRPNGIVERWTYDLAGRPTSTVIAPAGRGATGPPIWGQVYLYDAAGRRSLLFDANEGPTAYRYDSAGRLVEASLPPNGTIVADLARAISRLVGPARLPTSGNASPSSSVAGDGVERVASEYLEITPEQASSLQTLLRAAMPLSRALFRPSSPVVRVTYAYDAAGNRVAQTTPWGSVDYRYGADHTLMSAGLRRFSYDQDGNLVGETFGDESIEYRYSSTNRLTKVVFANPHLVHAGDGALASVAPARIEYAYDALGRRTLRRTRWAPLAPDARASSSREARSTSDPATVVTEESCDYDGLNLRLARSTLRTVAPDDPARVPFTTARGGRYRYLPPDTRGRTAAPADVVSRLYASGRLLETRSAGSTVYHSTDCLGSVVSSTDPNGALLSIARYSPFGASSTIGSANRLVPAFAGKNLDPLTGLYDFGMRDYSPLVGRWTTPDPIKSGTNWYLYAGNDPVNFVDPTGLLIEPVTLKYYQDRNPQTNKPESYADEVLGSVPPEVSDLELWEAETIGDSGCLLTAATRIANSINNDEATTPKTANLVAVDQEFFVPSTTAQIDEMTPESTAALISELTSVQISQQRYYGTETELEAKLNQLSLDTMEHYVIGHLVVGEGDSAYSHYVNIQAVKDDGIVAVADTSVTNRVLLDRRDERLVDIMVFTSKAR